jgi:hypothetical protein
MIFFGKPVPTFADHALAKRTGKFNLISTLPGPYGRLCRP